jgi:hypothetical protein
MPDYHLFANLRSANIIELQRRLSGKRRYSAFNCISAKHAEFVACDPQTFRIVGVMDLDDSPHRAAKRQQRDQFMDSALSAASISILLCVRRQRPLSSRMHSRLQPATPKVSFGLPR